ncbi:MAG: DUF5655 domain-containing protein [Christensenellales bacterium]|jgi:hypothetical protein
MPKLEQFFEDADYERSLFDALQERIMALDGVKMKVQKSQIAFSAGTQFAWVWFPMPWAKGRPGRPENCIIVSFSTDRPFENEKIVQRVEPYSGRFMHHVVVSQPGDLDEDLWQWLEMAHRFALSRSRKTDKEQ